MTSNIEDMLNQCRSRFVALGSDTQGKLLLGVAQAIAEHGAHKTTVQHILNAAGISRRTFYLQFENKDDALDALFMAVTQGFLGDLEGMIAQCQDPTDAAVCLSDLYLSVQLTAGRAALAMHAEATRPESRLFARREALLDRLSELLRARFEQEWGAPVDALHMRAVLLGVEGVIIHLKRQDALDASCRERITRLVRALLERPNS